MVDTVLSVPATATIPNSLVPSNQGERPIADPPNCESEETDNTSDEMDPQEFEEFRKLLKQLSCPGFAPDGSGLAYKKFSKEVC